MDFISNSGDWEIPKPIKQQTKPRKKNLSHLKLLLLRFFLPYVICPRPDAYSPWLLTPLPVIGILLPPSVDFACM